MTEREELIEEIISLNPCPECGGSGMVEVGIRNIAFGSKSGKKEVDLDVCGICDGKRTLVDLSFEDMKEEG